MYTKDPRKRLLDIAVIGSALAVVAWGLLGCAAESKPTREQQVERVASTPSSPIHLVRISAKRSKAKPFGDGVTVVGGPYTCVRAVVHNNTKTGLEVGPTYFYITGADGEKREISRGVSEDEFDSMTLAPGEKASGIACTETSSPPKFLTFVSVDMSELARTEVSG